LLFKVEKVWLIVEGIETKPIAPTMTQIVVGIIVFLDVSLNIISKWGGKTHILIIINNCLDNNIVFHSQSSATTHEAYDELTKLFESKDIVINMELKDKLHTQK